MTIFFSACYITKKLLETPILTPFSAFLFYLFFMEIVNLFPSFLIKTFEHFRTKMTFRMLKKETSFDLRAALN